MIKQTWTVSEEEKKRILNLHESATKKQYLVTEQTKPQTVNTVFPTQNIGDKFAFGEYDSQNVKNSILLLKPKIEEFIKNSGENKFSINISSGESNVTNPKGFETKGSLGLARANSVKKYFQEMFPDLIKQGVLVINSPKSESEVKIGETPYNKEKGDNKNPELIKKYREEQFVTFDVSGAGKNNIGGNDSICRLNIDKPGKQGLASNNYITTDRKLIDFGTITLNSESIPDRMVIYNSKNQIVKDTGYVTTRPHKYTQFKYVPEYVAGLTRLNGTPAVSGSKIITIQADNVEDLLKQLLVDPSVIPSVESFKPMGPEVYQGMRLLERLLRQKVTTFVIYEVSQGDVSIEVNASQQDTRLVVMSPLGKTGYTVKGACPQQP
jgi:hypothetical protein